MAGLRILAIAAIAIAGAAQAPLLKTEFGVLMIGQAMTFDTAA